MSLIKKLISFTLWGKDPMYTVGAVKNAILQKEMYPGWVCRFYVDDTVPKETLDQLHKLGCELAYKPRTEDHLASFWRFEPMLDKSVSYFIVRDVDARLDDRESKAVDQWIASGLPVHIIRDHPNHTHVMMGGTWGAVPGVIPSFEQDFNRYLSNLPRNWELFREQKFFNYDQIFLKECVWPHIKDCHIAHDEFVRHTGKEISFPVKRNSDTHFVGQKYTADDTPVFSINRLQ
jgi:protein O-GlcNAc transferase